MTIRTKTWLLMAVSVALTVGVASWLRPYVTRRVFIQDAKEAAEDLAKDLVEDLESFEADADDRDLAHKLHGYLSRHRRILRLDLYVERETTSRIVAEGGEPLPEITRLASFHRERHQVVTRQTSDASIPPIEVPVDLKGPWKGTLVIKLSLGPVESIVRTEQRISLIFGAVLLVVLAVLSGFIADKVVGKPLEVMAHAMRDVEAGNLGRRVLLATEDEVGRLAQGFNRMLERLSIADAEIRAFNQRLADEIAAATRDLSDKNATLGQLNRVLNDMRRDNASKVRLATLGQLAAQLAHEIGTPLSSVSGHLQLALLQKDLQPPLRERLEVAAREIERIGRIVRDYLDSTRPLEPERRPTDVTRVVDEAVEVTRGSVETGRARASIARDIQPDMGVVLTDAGLLRQILVNLLANALDAAGDAGTVTLGARRDGGDVLVTISDTGSGIAPDDLRRIFEPFYTTKGRGKGTGLGLAICRELTAALGGTISVESEPGRGSAFTVRIPAAAAAMSSTETRLRAMAGGRAGGRT